MTEEEKRSIENLKEVLEYLGRLSKCVELWRRLRTTGLNVDDLSSFFNCIIAEINQIPEMRRSASVSTLRTLEKAIKANQNKELLIRIPTLRNVFENRPLISTVQDLRKTARRAIGISDRLLTDVIGDIQSHIGSILDNFVRIQKIMLEFIDHVGGTGIELVENVARELRPEARGALSEVLAIWFFLTPMGRTDDRWLQSRGPVKVKGEEVDVISINVERSELCIAEVKSSMHEKSVNEAFNQAISHAKFFENKEILKEVFSDCKTDCRPSSLALCFPIAKFRNRYDDIQEKLNNRLFDIEGWKDMNGGNLGHQIVEVYDNSRMIDFLDKKWKSDSRTRYVSLLKELGEPT